MTEEGTATAGGRGAAGQVSVRPVVRRRRRIIGGREHKVSVRFTDEEFADVSARAGAVRMSVAHYLAVVGLAGDAGAVRRSEKLDLLLHQLVMLREQVRKVGGNVNQVARLLHGTGEVARHAEASYRGATRVFAAVEAAVTRIDPDSELAGWRR